MAKKIDKSHSRSKFRILFNDKTRVSGRAGDDPIAFTDQTQGRRRASSCSGSRTIAVGSRLPKSLFWGWCSAPFLERDTLKMWNFTSPLSKKFSVRARSCPIYFESCSYVSLCQDLYLPIWLIVGIIGLLLLLLLLLILVWCCRWASTNA